MRILLIRHGDPDYVNDTLTEKGRREAALLAKRADYIHAMESSDQMDAVTTITNLIEKLRKH